MQVEVQQHSIQAGASEMDAPRFDPIEDDQFTQLYVSKDLIANELDLYGNKWFDYRQLTPLQATRIYIDRYLAVYRKHFATNFDKHVSKFVTPFSIESIMKGLEESQLPEPPHLTAGQKKDRDKRIRKAKTALIGCWRGRQVADYLCMPYEVYIDLAMTYRLNFWNRSNMPMPTHLYLDWIVEKVVERWEELQTRKLYVSDDPAFLIQNFRGLGYQKDYHEWLFGQAGKRSNPPMFLAQFVNDEQLPMEAIELRCDEFTIERVNRHINH